MKTILVTLLMPVVFFAMLLVYTRVAGPLPLSVSSIVTTKTESFTVTAEGKSNSVPDTVHLSLGVQSNGPTVRDAQNDLNTRIAAVSEAIKALGINQKDIQTANYSIQPNYNWESGSQRITGYMASSNLQIKIREAEKANDVIDAGTTNGANIVGGISFEVSDREAAENQAREMAVAEARKKAETAARIAGFRLGKVVNYSESFGNRQPSIMPIMARTDVAEKIATPQLELGNQEIMVTVSLSYEML